MDEPYAIHSLEQLKAIADPLRMRIIETFSWGDVFTATQIAEHIGESPAKVHYHVRELERVGLLILAETREKGGILEKYYRLVSESLTLSPTLLHTSQDESVTAIVNWLNIVTQDAITVFRTLMERKRNNEEPIPPGSLLTNRIWLTREEALDLLERLRQLLEPYEKERTGEGILAYAMTYLFHPATRNPPPEPPTSSGKTD